MASTNEPALRRAPNSRTTGARGSRHAGAAPGSVRIFTGPTYRRRDRLDLRRDHRVSRPCSSARLRRGRLSLLARLASMAPWAAYLPQIAMNRSGRHTPLRRERGELVVDRFFSPIFGCETRTSFLGDVGVLYPDLRSWWSYVPHSWHTCRARVCLPYGTFWPSRLSPVRVRGSARRAIYLELACGGGSMSPEDLLPLVGVALADPCFLRFRASTVVCSISSPAAQELRLELLSILRFAGRTPSGYPCPCAPCEARAHAPRPRARVLLGRTVRRPQARLSAPVFADY